jgi:ATP-dependent RNA helicase DDX42
MDSLEAFMMGLEKDEKNSKVEERPQRREMPEEEDHNETFAKERAAKKAALGFQQGETMEDLEYDSDDMPVLGRKRIIESLAPLNHRDIEYEPFEKNFYVESESIARMTDNEMADVRRALKIAVQGESVPRLVSTFIGFPFPESLQKTISTAGFERPTPIQMQAVPLALAGRDVLGIAATGSGKTLSFVWPMLIHVAGQRMLNNSEPGPIGIIVAPTRELAQQIYLEAKKFAKSFVLSRNSNSSASSSTSSTTIRVAPLLGGMGRGDTRAMLKSHPHEIVVATPGRLIDMIKSKLISTRRTTMLVLDEADKMFDMGFEPQVRSIVGQIRPDRQTMLFSATFKPNVESLARDILRSPVRITVGAIGGANQDVTQVVEVVRDDQEKWLWLSSRLFDFTLDGSVLIFAGSKQSVDDLCQSIRRHFAQLTVASLHGDKTPDERNQTMLDFKNEKFKILVATDLAARGLDVKSIKTVVNWQSAKDIDSHTHRIGRTGRAGDKCGIAYSLITPNEVNFAAQLVKNLEMAKQEVPQDLLSLALRSPKFRPSTQHYHARGGSHHFQDEPRGPRSQGGRSEGHSGRNASFHHAESSATSRAPQSAQYIAPSNQSNANMPLFVRSEQNLATVEPQRSAKAEAYNPFGAL